MKPGLNNIIALCHAMGDPHHNLKIIHVAGTNGKGTVSHLIAGMLQFSGHKVGLHTSPHYIDFRERMKVDGELAPKSFIVESLNEFMDFILEIQPSFFELSVALSFLYFHKQKVDYAVVEVGLGGRLDSTNVVQPLLSVITNISFDHMEVLGHTLELIATEKAGIMKSHVPCLIGEYQNDVAHVFSLKALNLNADLYFSKDILEINITESDYGNSKFTVSSLLDIDFEIDISGAFQVKNIATAFAAVQLLEKQGTFIDYQNIKEKFTNFKMEVNYMGRWQVLGKNPLIIADSAHNEGGVDQILSLFESTEFEKMHIVLGFVRDKDRTKVLNRLPKVAKYYFCNASIPRALASNELKKEAITFGLHGEAFSSVSAAYEKAKNNANSNDLIFIGGSIFVVAEIL
jgi:dihydrofolate synthase/folylpolyglutamate synthase